MSSVPVWWHSCDVWLQAECSGKCKSFLQLALFSLLFIMKKKWSNFSKNVLQHNTHCEVILQWWEPVRAQKLCSLLTYSIPCASWLICTYQAFSSVDRRLYTLCWSQLGFWGLALVLVNINSNKGKQRESIYTSNNYSTLNNNINEQSVKIHIHECFKNAKNPGTLAH